MNPFARRNPVVRRRPDGKFDLVLGPAIRDDLVGLLDEFESMAEADPSHPDLRRLHPPAYLDDPDQEAAYQILAGDELRTSRQRAFEATRHSLTTAVLTEDEVWLWLRSLNSVRLVVGTRLGIEDDESSDPPEGDLSDEDASLWELWELLSVVQHFILEAVAP